MFILPAIKKRPDSGRCHSLTDSSTCYSPHDPVHADWMALPGARDGGGASRGWGKLRHVHQPRQEAPYSCHRNHGRAESLPVLTIIITVPTKSLETTCHFPITFHYNTMSYQIKKNSYAFSNTLI